tara:strand:+ start:334 stop:1092 length:759 start_codon:yes stop_codon:yes gene_type:complete
MTNHKMFKEKTLIIPDYVMPLDIERIHNWFENYDIANVEKVTFHLHEEPEYYVESHKDYYGYAVIEINHWYTNVGAYTFYDNIFHKQCKMVFDDPCYWEVEFYDYNQYNTRDQNDDIASPIEYQKSDEYDLSNNVASPIEYQKSDESGLSNNVASPRECLESEYDIDIKEDKDYLYESTEDDKSDYTYEYKIYSNLDKKSSVGKKQRTRYTEEEEIDDVVVVINKNYKKRDRQKEFKNVWARRLRQKYYSYM